MISLACAFVQAFLVSSLEATLPIRLGTIFGYGSGESGLMFMTLMIPTILAPLIGKLNFIPPPRAAYYHTHTSFRLFL